MLKAENTIYKVKDSSEHVLVLEEYSNGYVTTDGFFEKDKLIPEESKNITYDSKHCTELPFNWPDIYFIDDKANTQLIKEVLFDEDPAYIMFDGSLSSKVTIA